MHQESRELFHDTRIRIIFYVEIEAKGLRQATTRRGPTKRRLRTSIKREKVVDCEALMTPKVWRESVWHDDT